MSSLDLTQLSPEDQVGLAATLNKLLRGVKDALGPNLVGVYLVGSYALGAGDSHSDVDFAVVTHAPVSPASLSLLEKLHETLPALSTFGADHLEGSYLPAGDLRGASGAGWLYVDNGSRMIERSSHDNTLAFRWVLRNRGIPLVGPEPTSLLEEVDDSALREEARARAVSWRGLLASHPETVGDSWAQTYFVTGLCRLLYTYETGAITSKLEATMWAAERLDPAWTGLLERAVADRATTWQRVGRPAEPALAAETVRLGAEIARLMESRES